MGKGPKLHLKRLAAPKHWYLSKLGGNYAPRPLAGAHKLRECLPLVVLLRNKLKYALTSREATMIAYQRVVRVDGRVRTNIKFPVGFQDVVHLDRTNETFRMLWDTKGRFVAHKITPEEAKYKLCRVNKAWISTRAIPTISTHDGRTIMFVRPDIHVGDVVRVDIETGKVVDHLKLEVGATAMVTSGNNVGRVGTVVRREKHPGSVEIVYMKDARDKEFATRAKNVFCIGTNGKLWCSLPKGEGIRKTIVEDRSELLEKNRR